MSHSRQSSVTYMSLVLTVPKRWPRTRRPVRSAILTTGSLKCSVLTRVVASGDTAHTFTAEVPFGSPYVTIMRFASSTCPVQHRYP
eukprot:1659520-Pyramimonas_sp.AAC.1